MTELMGFGTVRTANVGQYAWQVRKGVKIHFPPVKTSSPVVGLTKMRVPILSSVEPTETSLSDCSKERPIISFTIPKIKRAAVRCNIVQEGQQGRGL